MNGSMMRSHAPVPSAHREGNGHADNRFRLYQRSGFEFIEGRYFH